MPKQSLNGKTPTTSGDHFTHCPRLFAVETWIDEIINQSCHLGFQGGRNVLSIGAQGNFKLTCFGDEDTTNPTVF